MGNKVNNKDQKGSPPTQTISETPNNNSPYKIVILGDTGVGKKTLLIRATQGHFEEHYLQFDYEQVVQWTLEDIKLNLLVYPIPGYRFNQRRPPYRGTLGVLLCFDCENGLSYWNLLKWRQEVERYCEEECRIVIVETRNDSCQRVVPEGAGKAMADLMGVPFCSTSAKSGEGVKQCLEIMAKTVADIDGFADGLSSTYIRTGPPPKIQPKKKGIKLNLKPKTKTKLDSCITLESLPEELLSIILGDLNASALYRLTSTAKNMSIIWKHIKQLDLTVGIWSLTYTRKIIPLLSKNSHLFFSIPYQYQHQQKKKLDDLISKSEEYGILLHIKSTGYYPWGLPTISPLTGASIVELENLLNLEELYSNYEKLPALKKFKVTTLPSNVLQKKQLPSSIEELIITNPQVPLTPGLTNLKSLTITGIHNVDWLKSLTQLTYLDINVLPPLPLLPASLRSLKLSNMNVDLQNLINYTCLKSLETSSLISPYLLSSFKQITSLKLSKVALDDLDGLSNIESLTISDFSGSFGTLKPFHLLHTLSLTSPQIEFDPSILYNKPLLTSLSLLTCNLKPSDITPLPHLQLKKLNLSGNSYLDNTIFDHLTKLCSLEVLDLSYILHINSMGIQSLSSLNLLDLHISGCFGVEYIEKWRFPEATLKIDFLGVTPLNLATLLKFRGIQPPVEK